MAKKRTYGFNLTQKEKDTITHLAMGIAEGRPNAIEKLADFFYKRFTPDEMELRTLAKNFKFN